MSLPQTDLPVAAFLPDVVAALETPGAAVLVAPPGTGKTTLVPLALAAAREGRVIVAEPRRLAARAAARRMSHLLGTQPGTVVGWTVRGERRVLPDTRIEVVTTGVLLQRLLRDPELPGVSAVVLDECHERHLDADLALAFCVDVRAVLRPDLALLATSATADVPRITAALAPAADGAIIEVPVIEVATAGHPVDVVWSPPPQVPARAVARPPAGAAGRVEDALLEHVAAVTARAWHDGDGDVLTFLPGLAEIARVAAHLRERLPADVVVATLHGSLGAAAQDAVLRGADGRRVVLASAVAESSVTVPGVRTVVDSGLSRIARADPSRGLARLVTVPTSRAIAAQRAGRAGREAPGVAHRCWTPNDHEHRPAHPEPEIATADLTAAALALACWGSPDGHGLTLIDSPPPGPLAAAREVLHALGAVDETGSVTPRGKVFARAGVHPRLARALVDGAARVGARTAAEIVAALADDSRGTHHDEPDLAEVVASLRRGRCDAERLNRWRTETSRLLAVVEHAGPSAAPTPTGRGAHGDDPVGLVAALAYPDRVGRRRADGSGYLLSGGLLAVLPTGRGRVEGAPDLGEWIVVTDAAISTGRDGVRSVRVRQAAALEERTAVTAGDALIRRDRDVSWHDGDVVARERRYLGSLLLGDRPARDVTDDEWAHAVREGLRRDGLAVLAWTPAAIRFRQRLATCRRWQPEGWPDVGGDALLRDVDWLEPGLSRCRSRRDLGRLDVRAALATLLPWTTPAKGPGSLDDLVPERLTVPSGSAVAVDYADPERPVLAVKLQECFGLSEGPRVMAGTVPVVLHLLSPAGRPLAVTSDLASFWDSAYPDVRAQMRGRYPKHPWPQNPAAAQATRLTSAALRRSGPPGT